MLENDVRDAESEQSLSDTEKQFSIEVRSNDVG